MLSPPVPSYLWDYISPILLFFSSVRFPLLPPPASGLICRSVILHRLAAGWRGVGHARGRHEAGGIYPVGGWRMCAGGWASWFD